MNPRQVKTLMGPHPSKQSLKILLGGVEKLNEWISSLPRNANVRFFENAILFEPIPEWFGDTLSHEGEIEPLLERMGNRDWFTRPDLSCLAGWEQEFKITRFLKIHNKRIKKVGSGRSIVYVVKREGVTNQPFSRLSKLSNSR